MSNCPQNLPPAAVNWQGYRGVTEGRTVLALEQHEYTLGQQACLLCSEKMGEEQTGPEQRGEKNTRKSRTHPKDFDFSNTAES
jgi:hypothetical protein